jgi:hypothetical protein
LDEVVHECDADLSGKVVIAGGGLGHRTCGVDRGSAKAVEHREKFPQTGLRQLIDRKTTAVADSYELGIAEPAQVVGKLSGRNVQTLG